jgi:hypothetical protein
VACEGDTLSQRRAWRRAVYEVIQTMASSLPQGQVTIERLCRLARVSRAGYYRLWQASAPRQHDTAVRDAIQRLVLANGRYRRGYRYITRQLRHDGLIVNHKRVRRLMREDNLLSLRRRPLVPSTTEARHPWPVVPNRARDMQLSAFDQLWGADITYIRLHLYPAARGIRLSGDRPRCLQPPCRQLGIGRSSRRQPGGDGVGHGAGSAPPARGQPGLPPA